MTTVQISPEFVKKELPRCWNKQRDNTKLEGGRRLMTSKVKQIKRQQTTKKKIYTILFLSIQNNIYQDAGVFLSLCLLNSDRC
jgi:heptaprenylglyceryl phosphate synthase